MKLDPSLTPHTKNTLKHSFESYPYTCKAQGWNEANTHKNKHENPTAKPVKQGQRFVKKFLDWKGWEIIKYQIQPCVSKSRLVLI